MFYGTLSGQYSVAISSVVYRFRIIDITIKRIYSWVSLKDSLIYIISITQKSKVLIFNF